MGGILNQHRDKAFEHEAHVVAHTPSTRSKRDSYPPHPAIVGAGPGSPYARVGDAGVGARYLGGGRYEDDDEESDVSSVGPVPQGKTYVSGVGGKKEGGGKRQSWASSRSGSLESEGSFEKPKKTPRWKIWKVL
jgi:hypothetical protein